MSYWRSEYDDGWWTFYKNGIEIKLDNPNFGDLIVDEINNANKRIAELEAQQRWIPVEERLPENKFDHVLVCTTYGVSVRLALEIGEAVTHWMPLPEPPEVTE